MATPIGTNYRCTFPPQEYSQSNRPIRYICTVLIQALGVGQCLSSFLPLPTSQPTFPGAKCPPLSSDLVFKTCMSSTPAAITLVKLQAYDLQTLFNLSIQRLAPSNTILSSFCVLCSSEALRKKNIRDGFLCRGWSIASHPNIARAIPEPLRLVQPSGAT